jgi:hypothetical protein
MIDCELILYRAMCTATELMKLMNNDEASS